MCLFTVELFEGLESRAGQSGDFTAVLFDHFLQRRGISRHRAVSGLLADPGADIHHDLLDVGGQTVEPSAIGHQLGIGVNRVG